MNNFSKKVSFILKPEMLKVGRYLNNFLRNHDINIYFVDKLDKITLITHGCG